MSNIDHCFDNMFTNPKSPQGVSHFRSLDSRWLGARRPSWTAAEAATAVLSAGPRDEGPHGRAPLLRRRVRGARRLFRVHPVEEALARQGLRHDAEGTLRLQAGGLLRSPQRAVWALLWSARQQLQPRKWSPPRTLMDRWLKRLTFAGLQVREEWRATETSPGQRTWRPSATLSWRARRREGCTSSWPTGWEQFRVIPSHSSVRRIESCDQDEMICLDF